MMMTDFYEESIGLMKWNNDDMQVFNVNFYYKFYCSLNIVHNNIHRTTLYMWT